MKVNKYTRDEVVKILEAMVKTYKRLDTIEDMRIVNAYEFAIELINEKIEKKIDKE